MKKETIIYTMLSGLMISGASIASDTEFTEAEKKHITQPSPIEITSEVLTATQDTEITQLKASLASKNEVIIALDSELETTREKYVKISRELAARTLRIEKLELEVESKDLELVLLKEKLALQEKHIFGEANSNAPNHEQEDEQEDPEGAL